MDYGDERKVVSGHCEWGLASVSSRNTVISIPESRLSQRPVPVTTHLSQYVPRNPTFAPDVIVRGAHSMDTYTQYIS